MRSPTKKLESPLKRTQTESQTKPQKESEDYTEKDPNKKLKEAASNLQVCQMWEEQNPGYLDSEDHLEFCHKLQYKQFRDCFITKPGDSEGAYWIVLDGKVGYYVKRDSATIDFENDIVKKLIDHFNGKTINKSQLADLIKSPPKKDWTPEQVKVVRDFLHITKGKVYYTNEFLANTFKGISTKNVYTNWNQMFDPKTGILKESLDKVCEKGEEIHTVSEVTISLGNSEMAFVTLIELEETNKKNVKFEEEALEEVIEKAEVGHIFGDLGKFFTKTAKKAEDHSKLFGMLSNFCEQHPRIKQREKAVVDLPILTVKDSLLTPEIESNTIIEPEDNCKNSISQNIHKEAYLLEQETELMGQTFWSNNFKSYFVDAHKEAPATTEDSLIILWDFYESEYLEDINDYYWIRNHPKEMEKVRECREELKSIKNYDPYTIRLYANEVSSYSFYAFIFGMLVAYICTFISRLSGHKYRFNSVFWLWFVPIWTITYQAIKIGLKKYLKKRMNDQWGDRQKNLYTIIFNYNNSYFDDNGMLLKIGKCGAWLELRRKIKGEQLAQVVNERAGNKLPSQAPNQPDLDVIEEKEEMRVTINHEDLKDLVSNNDGLGIKLIQKEE